MSKAKGGLLMFALASLLTGLLLTLIPAREAVAEEEAVNSLPVAEGEWERYEPRQYLYLKYPQVAKKVDAVIICESGWDATARNRGSSATGLAQFLNSTWINTRTRMGESADFESRLDPYEHIDTTVWLWKHDGVVHWLESQNCHHIY